MKDVILRQKIERDELVQKPYVLRELLQNAKKSMKDTLIKVITGPRRAGKSVFAIQLLEGIHFGYLNFDDERLIEVKDYENLIKAIREVYGETNYLLFDEIQNLPRWELFVNKLHRRGFNLVITGSNSRLLSKELGTHLTGRYLSFPIFPFSFREFLKARDLALEEAAAVPEKQGLLLNRLDEYIREGGYPEVVVKGVDPKSYLATLFESILFKDVVKRYNVRYSKKLHDLGLFLITNHSREFSYTSLKKALSFRSVHTVENYLEYIMDAYLLFAADRFSPKIKEQMKSPRKAYAYDTGLINAVKFKITPDSGRLMENLVAAELLRRGKEICYYKTKDGKEVDFAVREGLKIGELLQVCYEVSDIFTRKREVDALLKAGREVECKLLTVLTWDFESEEKFGSQAVQYLPLWKWLGGEK